MIGRADIKHRQVVQCDAAVDVVVDLLKSDLVDSIFICGCQGDAPNAMLEQIGPLIMHPDVLERDRIRIGKNYGWFAFWHILGLFLAWARRAAAESGEDICVVFDSRSDHRQIYDSFEQSISTLSASANGRLLDSINRVNLKFAESMTPSRSAGLIADIVAAEGRIAFDTGIWRMIEPVANAWAAAEMRGRLLSESEMLGQPLHVGTLRGNYVIGGSRADVPILSRCYWKLIDSSVAFVHNSAAMGTLRIRHGFEADLYRMI